MSISGGVRGFQKISWLGTGDKQSAKGIFIFQCDTYVAVGLFAFTRWRHQLALYD